MVGNFGREAPGNGVHRAMYIAYMLSLKVKEIELESVVLQAFCMVDRCERVGTVSCLKLIGLWHYTVAVSTTSCWGMPRARVRRERLCHV